MSMMIPTCGGGDAESSSCSSKNKKRSRRSTEEEEAPPLLPHDVICVVLSKLPVKSILRFRSVCKSWEHLISQPFFIELQLAEARKSPPRNNILVVTNRDPNGSTFVPSMWDPNRRVSESMILYSIEEEEAAASEPPNRRQLVEICLDRGHQGKTSVCRYDCDGLILLISQTEIWVCNPATREGILGYDFSDNMPIHKDAFQHIGFGLDPTTKSHKIVRMFYRSFYYDEEEDEIYGESVGCEVLTVGAGSNWRQVDDPPYAPKEAYSARANGGLLYWMTLRDDYVLLSFDLKNDKFGVLAPPSALLSGQQSQCHLRYIMNGHGDRLWFVNVDRDATTTDIWELTQVTKQLWTKIHSIAHPATLPAEINILPIPKLVIRNGRCILLCDRQKLQCYDIKTKECKTIFDIHNGKGGGGGPVDYDDWEAPAIYPCLYRETLASVKAKNKDCVCWGSHLKLYHGAKQPELQESLQS